MALCHLFLIKTLQSKHDPPPCYKWGNKDLGSLICPRDTLAGGNIMAEAQAGSTLNAFTQHKPARPCWAPCISAEPKLQSDLERSCRVVRKSTSPQNGALLEWGYTILFTQGESNQTGTFLSVRDLASETSSLDNQPIGGTETALPNWIVKLLQCKHEAGSCSEHEVDPSYQHIWCCCHKKLANTYAEKKR